MSWNIQRQSHFLSLLLQDHIAMQKEDATADKMDSNTVYMMNRIKHSNISCSIKTGAN
jgi:hypothetical protein